MDKASDQELEAYLALAQDARDRQLRAMGLGQGTANADYKSQYDQWLSETDKYNKEQSMFSQLAAPLLEKWGLMDVGSDLPDWASALF